MKCTQTEQEGRPLHCKFFPEKMMRRKVGTRDDPVWRFIWSEEIRGYRVVDFTIKMVKEPEFGEGGVIKGTEITYRLRENGVYI